MCSYNLHPLQRETACTAITFLMHYSFMSTFFWMLVEGLYLLVKVRPELCHRVIHVTVWIAIGWGKFTLVFRSNTKAVAPGAISKNGGP